MPTRTRPCPELGGAPSSASPGVAPEAEWLTSRERAGSPDALDAAPALRKHQPLMAQASSSDPPTSTAPVASTSAGKRVKLAVADAIRA